MGRFVKAYAWELFWFLQVVIYVYLQPNKTIFGGLLKIKNFILLLHLLYMSMFKINEYLVVISAI